VVVVSSSDDNPPAKASIPAGTLAGYTEINYKYSTYATDPDGDQVKYTFDWGDGNASTTSLVSSGTISKASHAWTVAPGTRKVFDVRAKATDTHGKDSSWSITQTVVIVAEALNHPPSIPSKPVGPITGIGGASYSYSTSSTDPDGNYIKYIFDWGDGTSETNYVPSGQVVTMSHVWTHVPVGTTRTYNVRVASADSKYALCADWSEPLVVAITGSLNSVQAADLQSEEVMQSVELMELKTNESDFVDPQTNESDFVDSQTNESDFVDAPTEESDFVDSQINESDFVDAPTEESDFVDAQTNESEFVDAQTEESDFVDAQTNESEFVDAQTIESEFVDAPTEESDSVDTQTASPTRLQMEIANLTKLQSPSSEIATYRMK
jgi:hypothetical protein